jgi:hypothetical protein
MIASSAQQARSVFAAIAIPELLAQTRPFARDYFHPLINATLNRFQQI